MIVALVAALLQKPVWRYCTQFACLAAGPGIAAFQPVAGTVAFVVPGTALRAVAEAAFPAVGAAAGIAACCYN